MRPIHRSLLCGLLLSTILAVTLPAQTTTNIVRFTVNIRAGVAVEMGATVISRPGGASGRSVLVLNGTSQTANTFTTLAQSLLASNAGVFRVILLDYPGRGHSGLPVGGGVTFGDLNMDDYVTVLLASLERLGDMGLAPTAIMGHSLGAELTHMAQTRLVRSGANLRSTFGISSAIFLVPDIAAPLPWAAVDAGAFDPLVAIFGRNDPVLGSVFDLVTPPGGAATWLSLFYADRTGVLVPGTPTPPNALASGWIAIESAAVISQLIGLPTVPGGPRLPRPTIDAEIFTASTGTVAGVAALEQSGFYVFPSEHRALYEFLTGDAAGSLFFPLTGPGTVHNLHTIQPGIYNAFIKQVLSAGSASAETSYLHAADGTLFLDANAPTATAAQFENSPAVHFKHGNPWREVGTWVGAPADSARTITALSDLRVWLGLKNSDDQGTRFDLRAEVLKNGLAVASGETYCITGLTRNPNLAKEVAVSFGAIANGDFAAGDQLSLRVLTRIGTKGGAFCGGHSNAAGLRLYFDAVTRPAAFDATVF